MKSLVAVFLLSATLGCGEGWQVQPDPLDALRESAEQGHTDAAMNRAGVPDIISCIFTPTPPSHSSSPISIYIHPLRDAYHQLRARREGDRPEDKLFRYNHEPGFRELLKSLDLYTDPSSGMTRNTKSLRVTGINLRLLKNPGVPLNDLRKWCRTSIVQIQHFYDQAHPETSAARVAGRTESSKTQ